LHKVITKTLTPGEAAVFMNENTLCGGEPQRALEGQFFTYSGMRISVRVCDRPD
jgi:hypothetical protein